MNNLRSESHVAQKNRRHKLRFQQNSDDPTRFGYGSISYDPSVFPPEMLHSIASNPHLLLPPNHVNFMDQNSGSGSQWKSVNVNNHSHNQHQSQVQVSNEWNNVGSMNMDQGYNQDLQNNVSLCDQKNSGEIPAFGSYYQNTLQEVVTSATVGSTHVQINQSIPCNWMNGSSDHQLGFTQGLSLSLSSNSVPRAKPEFPMLHSGQNTRLDGQKVCSDPKQHFAQRAVGPLGPFTGYATILKNSKYLKPAQELLNDNCRVAGEQTCDSAHKVLEEEMSRVSGESGASSSTVYGSNDYITGRSSSLSESYRPEFHHKKAKLLYMQEEV